MAFIMRSPRSARCGVKSMMHVCPAAEIVLPRAKYRDRYRCRYAGTVPVPVGNGDDVVFLESAR